MNKKNSTPAENSTTNERGEQMVHIIFHQNQYFFYFSKFKIDHQVLSLKLFIVMGIPWIFEFVHFLLTVNIDNLGCYLSFQVEPPTIWQMKHILHECLDNNLYPTLN